MPLPDSFFEKDTSPLKKRSDFQIYPDFGEEDVEDKGSAFDAIGQALWSAGAHFVSGGTM